MRSNWMRRANSAFGEITLSLWNAHGNLPGVPTPSRADSSSANDSTHSSDHSPEPSPSPSPSPAPAADCPAIRPAPKRKELPQFGVMLHNDDISTMDHVVRCIVSLTPLPRTRAHLVMLMAHIRGSALVLITHRERAELYQQQFRRKGLLVSLEAM